MNKSIITFVVFMALVGLTMATFFSKDEKEEKKFDKKGGEYYHPVNPVYYSSPYGYDYGSASSQYDGYEPASKYYPQSSTGWMKYPTSDGYEPASKYYPHSSTGWMKYPTSDGYEPASKYYH